ncbi:VG15 protein [Nesterenkonia suensis]
MLAAHVEELRRFNERVLRGLPGTLRELEGRLAGGSPELVRDGLLELVPGVADRYGRVMAEGTADWYERARVAVVGGSFVAVPADLPDPDVVQRNVRWAAGALFVEDRVSPFQTLEGPLIRQVMGVGRNTVSLNARADRRARGWQRQARADSCARCQDLSGNIYPGGDADFPAHDNCRCVAVPVFR